MYAISVMFEIDPAHVDDFKAAALTHARNSETKESGCLGFAVFQSPEKPARFYFHEVYNNKAAVDEVHSKAPYLAEFGRVTKPWIVKKELETWESAE